MLRRNVPRRNPSEFRQNTTPDHACWHKTCTHCKGASCAADFSVLLPFVEMCILSIPALPRSQQDDGQRDGSRHLCSLPTTQNPKAIDWSLLRKGSANVLHFCRPPMTTTGNDRATILQFSTDDDDGGQLSRQLSLLPSRQNQKSPAFLTSAANDDNDEQR